MGGPILLVVYFAGNWDKFLLNGWIPHYNKNFLKSPILLVDYFTRNWDKFLLNGWTPHYNKKKLKKSLLMLQVWMIIKV